MKIFLAALIFFEASVCTAQITQFYVGSTSKDTVKTIPVCELNEETENLRIVNWCSGAKGSSYLALSNDKKLLYTTSYEVEAGTDDNLMVVAYRLSDDGKKMTIVNAESAKGRGTCHVSLSPNNDYAFAANYRSGDIAALPIAKDGSLLKSTAYAKHSGSGPVADRQQSPHAHYINTSNDGKYIFVCDLGIDKVMAYQLDEKGQFIPNKHQPFLQMEAGDGPRHLAFHPNNKQVFVLNELSSTVASCTYDAEKGLLSIVDTKSTLPDDFKDFTKAAAIRIHPNGKYLYCTNRGYNSIAVYEISESGKLELLQIYSSEMGWLRDINITPSGKYLLAQNKLENEIVLLKVSKSGTLSATGKKLNVPEPSCIVFF